MPPSFLRPAVRVLCTFLRKSSTLPAFETLAVTRPSDFVVQVELNRPNLRNSLNKIAWTEIGQCFDYLCTDSDCRVVLLTGAGKMFCAGLDFKEMMKFGEITADSDKDVARKGLMLNGFIRQFQECLTALEKCHKPVISSVHGAAIGGGLAVILPSDIRYATQDTFFSIREVNIGIAADIGALQRMPKLVGNESWVRELAFTARDFDAEEALKMGLISRVFPTKEEMYKASLELAQNIAAKSPTAVQGTKINLNYSRDHTIQEGLDFAATWNMCFLQGEDVFTAAMAVATRQEEPPTFNKV